MEHLLGRNIIIYADNTAIAAQKSCVIGINYDLIEKASPTSGKAKEYLLGRYDWEVTVNGLIPAVGFEDYLLTAGKTLSIKVLDVENIGGGLKGQVLCKSSQIAANLSSFASGNLTFKGNGPLKKIDESAAEVEASDNNPGEVTEDGGHDEEAAPVPND